MRSIRNASVAVDVTNYCAIKDFRHVKKPLFVIKDFSRSSEVHVPQVAVHDRW